jgi:hypothetical protein
MAGAAQTQRPLEAIQSISVIGLNLTNRYYWNYSSQVPFTGGVTGGKTSSLSDEWAVVSSGREVILKWQYKFK